MTWRIPLADLTIGPEEEAAVLDVIRRRWLTMGEITHRFEAEFATFVGSRHALAVTNGTAALHLAGAALGWGPGDEVIVPALTFVATANAVLATGAQPVFADVTDELDFSISVTDIADKITPRTRAIIVVHYAGYACDMPRLMALARERGLDVVEDAAHTPGASLEDKSLGAWGAIGCFSFFSNKNMTTGEGGMVTTDDDQLAERLRLLRSHGMTTLTWDRHRGHAWSYDVTMPGFNYRLDEMRSALGRVQLSRLPKSGLRRQALNDMYIETLTRDVPEVTIPYVNHPGVSSYHIRPILLPYGVDRRLFMAKMRDYGIQTSIHYPPIHLFSAYRESTSRWDYQLPLTEAIARREVTLPLYPAMSHEDLEYVVAAVADALPAATRRQYSRVEQSKG